MYHDILHSNFINLKNILHYSHGNRENDNHENYIICVAKTTLKSLKGSRSKDYSKIAETQW